MTRILTYLIGTVLINGLVLGAPYWRMLNNLENWLLGRMTKEEVFGFYDDVSWIRLLIIGLLEWALVMLLLPKDTTEQNKTAKPMERRASGRRVLSGKPAKQ